MFNSGSLVLLCLFLPAGPIWAVEVESECLVPTSPNCRIDCSAETFDILCADHVKWRPLRDDFERLGKMGHMINILFLNFDSTNMQLDSNLFGSAESYIQRMSLHNLRGLRMFPNLRAAHSLLSLHIIDAPQVTDFVVENLPVGLREIRLFNTGITRLEIDFNELSDNMTAMESFTVQGANLTYIQSNFFRAFPNLKTVRMKENRFNVTEDTISDDMFSTVNPLDQFIFKDNNFSATSQEDGTTFLRKTLKSLKLHDNTFTEASSVDLSGNSLSVNTDTLEFVKLLKDVRDLNLKGNPFENSMTITDLFYDFKNLRLLDLSSTQLPISRSAFRNLPNLDTLRLGGNNFNDMTAVDMFYGSQSSLLRVLDLSYNSLTALPEGDVEILGMLLEELELKGNNLLPIEFGTDFVGPLNGTLNKPTFSAFPSLKYIGLSANNWTNFDGTLLAPMQRLRHVDLSCNNFVQLTKDFFTDMPASVKMVNLSMCMQVDDDPLDVAADALSTLPPLETLILSNGNFRGWIFDRLKKMPNASLESLRNVQLQNNMIRFLSYDWFDGFAKLKTLNLRGNLLQSLGTKSLRNLPALETLIVSMNQIVKIDSNDFDGLNNLKNLDLHGNKITHIESGSFDTLSTLTNLYLGDNLLTGLDQIFVNGGGNLLQLGIQKNPIKCLKRSELDPLTGLRWLHTYQVTTPIFIDRLDEGSLKDKIYSEPFQSNDQLDCDTRFDFPVLHPADITDKDLLWETDFLRLKVQNPWDLTARTFYAHIAKCYVPKERNIQLLTGNLFCSMSDSKTATASNVPWCLSTIFVEFLLIFLSFYGL